MPNQLPKLIYFRGCPNAEIAEQRLAEAGIVFEKVCQDDLNRLSPYREFSSPTLLLDEVVVFGAATGEDGGCSLNLPDACELAKRLRSLRSK